jgi:hypothetical protein
MWPSVMLKGSKANLAKLQLFLCRSLPVYHLQQNSTWSRSHNSAPSSQRLRDQVVVLTILSDAND